MKALQAAPALKELPPTEIELDSESLKMWKALHGAFDFFNNELFQSRLDRNQVVLNCSRMNRALGFYCPPEIGWIVSSSDKNGIDQNKAEISLNPSYMANRSIEEIYSTFVHEMCHFEQDCFGKPGKRGYHNKEWATMMDNVGLKPFNVSDPTKRTGMRCSHSIIEDGIFAKVMKKMPEEFKLPFLGLRAQRTKAKTGYQKWKCPECGQICRAKETAQLTCTPCSMEAFAKYESGEVDTFEMVKMSIDGY